MAWKITPPPPQKQTNKQNNNKKQHNIACLECEQLGGAIWKFYYWWCQGRSWTENIENLKSTGALDKYNIIPNFFTKKLRFFIPLEMLAYVLSPCWVLSSWLTWSWRNLNLSSIFYFSKSTSINTQYKLLQ